MKEKLTREVFDAHKSTLWARYSVDEYGKFSNQMERLWEAIEEDRAGRFEIGEKIILHFPFDKKDVYISCTEENISKDLGSKIVGVSRPVAMRKMSREELEAAVYATDQLGCNTVKKVKDETLIDILMAKGISTEVEVTHA